MTGRVRRIAALTLVITAGLIIADLAGLQKPASGQRQSKETRQAGSRERKKTITIAVPVRQPGLPVSVHEDGSGTAEEAPAALRDDCSFLREPERYRGVQARHRASVSRITEAVSQGTEQAELSLEQAQNIPRRNFIDTILFDRMARDGVQSAPLSSDAEFIRRAYLDLTGRIPSATDVENFLASSNPAKRDQLVDSLIGSPEFIDKWTMFFNDLFRNTSFSTNIDRYVGGRDAFYQYIRTFVAENRSYNQVANEIITANGDSFVNGAVNFIVGGHVPMGPAQDVYDGYAVHIATTFLGVSSMDCLLCHDGEGHLEAVNLWGAQQKRADAWGLAAFFARTRRAQTTISQTPFYAKHTISEVTSGEYQLNTTTGNRSARQPINGVSTIQPKYMFNGNGGVNGGENRRQALARHITSDPQFARAAVNYIWEKLMVEALVSPSNTFDLARLTYESQMPEGWAPQPANPDLLTALADEFRRDNHNIRNLIALIVKSSAYQLSSQYPGEWRVEHVPYYARKFVRRLDAEEIHDAIVRATGIMPSYEMRADDNVTVTGRVNWAMQLAEPREPRRDGTGRAFLDSFLRGDRDANPREQESSILQSLNLMNNSFVMNRIHQSNTGSTVRNLLADATLTPEQIIEKLYLATLSRRPSQTEVDKLKPYFTTLSTNATTARRLAAESVQWVLLNKVDFIFNY